MDFGIIALVVVGAGKLLDYVAPRTKTTVDDKVRGAFQWALGFLPFVNKRLASGRCGSPGRGLRYRARPPQVT
jgi:hypothetical protein